MRVLQSLKYQLIPLWATKPKCFVKKWELSVGTPTISGNQKELLLFESNFSPHIRCFYSNSWQYCQCCPTNRLQGDVFKHFGGLWNQQNHLHQHGLQQFRLERHAQNSIDSSYNKWKSSVQVWWQSSATGMAAIALFGLTEINVQWQPGWFRELIYTWLGFVPSAFTMKTICSVDVDNFFVRYFCRSSLLIIKTSFNVNTEVCFMFICKMSVTPFKIAWLI